MLSVHVSTCKCWFYYATQNLCSWVWIAVSSDGPHLCPEHWDLCGSCLLFLCRCPWLPRPRGARLWSSSDGVWSSQCLGRPVSRRLRAVSQHINWTSCSRRCVQSPQIFHAKIARSNWKTSCVFCVQFIHRILDSCVLLIFEKCSSHLLCPCSVVWFFPSSHIVLSRIGTSQIWMVGI